MNEVTTDYNSKNESQQKHNVYPILTLSLSTCMRFQRGNSRTIKCISLLIGSIRFITFWKYGYTSDNICGINFVVFI